MNVIRFRCYNCYRVHRLQSSAVGRLGRCTCGKTMVVPEGTTDETVASEDLPLAMRPGEEAAAGAGAALAPASDELPAADAIEEEWETTSRDDPPGDLDVDAELDDAVSEPVAAEAPPRLEADFAADAVLVGETATGDVFTTEITTESKPSQGKAVMNKGYLIAALIVALVWLAHTSPWIYLGFEADLLSRPLPEAIGLVPDTSTGYGTHYLGLERAFWSALLAGLALSLGLESWLRRRRRPRAESWEDVTA